MKTSGKNALWNRLSPEQRKTLDGWLFEEKLGCEGSWTRAQAELGFTGSLASLKRYAFRRRQETTLVDLKESAEYVAGINGAPTDPSGLRTASMKLLGCHMFRLVHEAPENAKGWAPAANLMVQNDHNEIQREENQIRRERMEFAKEKLQFDFMRKALKALPQLQELAEAKKDPHTKRYEENARWNCLRREMFGPGINIHPENAQEEAEMAAAKKEREQRREQEAQVEREKIIDAQPPPPSSPYYQEYLEELKKREEAA